jgi:hypothetical protein
MEKTQEVRAQLRKRMHGAIPDQGKWLRRQAQTSNIRSAFARLSVSLQGVAKFGGNRRSLGDETMKSHVHLWSPTCASSLKSGSKTAITHGRHQ